MTELKCGSVSCMTQLSGLTIVPDFDRTTTVVPIEACPGACRSITTMAAELVQHDRIQHGRITQPDGTAVAESFQTRLTAQG